jgi:hypothetical protein
MVLVRFMVFNATFNNISVTLWRSVLLVEDRGVLGKKHRPVASHWQTCLNLNQSLLIWSIISYLFIELYCEHHASIVVYFLNLQIKVLSKNSFFFFIILIFSFCWWRIVFFFISLDCQTSRIWQAVINVLL